MTAYIEQNLAAVRQEMTRAERAARREGRTALIAAVKYASDQELEALLELGVAHVGENRVQQLLAHWPLYEKKNVQVHFIGALQKNKIKYIIDKVAAIHSVDSVELAAEINRHAKKHGLTVSVFAEVNIGREEAKSGVMPEALTALCRAIGELPHLSLCGVMTMAPKCESDEEYRGYFDETRRLAREAWQALGLAGEPRLSMGMSESFEAAIASGADLVRVGRRLFVNTPPLQPAENENTL